MASRKLIRVETLNSGYGPYEHQVPVDNVGAANLVTSKLITSLFETPSGRAGRHAPALDIDHPAQLLVDDAGTCWLHVDLPLQPRQVRRAYRALAAAGVSMPAGPSGTLHVDRYAQGAAAIMIELAADFEGDFEALAATAAGIAEDGHRHGREVNVDRGLLVALSCDALLIPSSTPGHHHLYLDVVLDKRRYFRLVRRLSRAGIVERGFAKVSATRGHTSLRVPGLVKAAA